MIVKFTRRCAMSFGAADTKGKKLFAGGNRSGLSLLEILIAMAVLLIGILAVIKIFPEGFVTIDHTNSAAVADSLAVYQLEELRALGYDGLPAIKTPPDGSNTDFYFLNCPAGFAVSDVEIAPGADKDYQVLDSAAYTITTGEDGDGDLSDDDILVSFVTPPSATDIIRLGFEVNVWKDKLVYTFNPKTGYKDGLEDGTGLIYVEYATDTDVASTLTATTTETSLKLVQVKVSWKERVKERSISRQALVGR
ncbi:MAG: hypothetical protein PHT33_00155 [bacterium]|nr:hypothetical protein [bacterium]